MERLTYLDTHAVVWLYAGELSLFPPGVLDLLSETTLMISPIVLLELQYLFEIGRIKAHPEKIFQSLEKSIGLKSCSIEFQKVVRGSLKQTGARDPFDRLIVSQAMIAKAALITKDEEILKNYSAAVWR